MAGPQRARLDTALTGAYEHVVDDHSREWTNCVRTLSMISQALVTASPEVKDRIGGETGPAIDRAFAKSAQGMEAKARQLIKGSGALQSASDVIRQARQEQAALNADTREKPGEYHPPVGQPTDEDLQKEAANKQAHAAYDAWNADQERRAQAQADRMDRVFEHSTAVMKEIHGEPDIPPPHGDPGGGSGGPSVGASGPAHAPAPAGGGYGPRPAHSPTPYDPPPGPGGKPGPGYQPGPGGGAIPTPTPGGGAPQGGSPVPIDYTPGGATGVPGTVGSGSTAPGGLGGSAVGVAGAAAGGLGGGALASGLAAGLRGGLTSPVVASPGTAASGVRGIGATGRTGISGALGGKPGVSAVSNGAGGTAAGRGTAASRGTAAGRGGRGASSAAGRGSRSGAGAGGTAAGRGGRRKDDEKGRKRDLFDASEDWVDDEDAAPSVID